jgi:hypothetical protein
LSAAALSFVFVTAAGADNVPSSSKRPALDPNQKVCETVTEIGSRLAAKKICATRAEWAEKRKQDRETVDDAQRSAHVGCNTVNTHSGTPTC